MKKTMVALMAAVSLAAFADDAKKDAEQAEVQNSSPFAFWGFGNAGFYSGYQLYGSILNTEPVIQTYVEGNVSMNFGGVDCGYLGIGLWTNSDLTKKRHDNYGRIFNETDPNIHWGRTFWFDENKTWGIDYRASVIWFYYPHHLYQKNKTFGKTSTTMDFDHSFALVNPYVVPFCTWVHEYHRNDADLWEFGLKRDFAVCEGLTVTPSVTGVIRDHRYNWCFAKTDWDKSYANGGWATLKYMLEANYQITANIGVFAKVAICQTVDRELREMSDETQFAGYGAQKDFVWGGAGLSFKF